MREGAGIGPAAAGREEAPSRFAAVERVIATLLPFFQRWTHGRLPSYARRRMDTGDVVQEAIVGVLRNLGHIDTVDPQALAKYLAIAIRNRIADEVRRASHGEVANRLTDPADPRASPLEEAIDSESHRHYRTALLSLGDDDQTLLVGRVELGLSFEELALVTKRASADSARVATRRAALRLARAMGRKPAGGSG
ncbi:MAG: sigma-70 family RNA polymerase sigma factor [Thermoanaerobaculia bacterium]|nr:sigma-70 family RNA polymerase sigma factor [Thermoanaerobaculia bacterium]MBP9824834.1 sigma-70 family RNA polymerase sigma factor [Thermoanaerobaculia bacterium]